MSRTIIICFALTFVLYLPGASAQKIRFGREFLNLRHSKKELEKIIAKDSSISIAFAKLKPYFILERGEKFTLIGKHCLEGIYRTRYFNIFPQTNNDLEHRAAVVTRSEERLQQRLRGYSGTLLLFNDQVIVLSDISDIFEISHVYYQYRLGIVRKCAELPFDPVGKTLTINKLIYLPPVRSVVIADPTITISYRHSKRVDTIQNLRITFATAQQKKMFRRILADCILTTGSRPINESPCNEALISDLKQNGITVFPEELDSLINH